MRFMPRFSGLNVGDSSSSSMTMRRFRSFAYDGVLEMPSDSSGSAVAEPWSFDDACCTAAGADVAFAEITAWTGDIAGIADGDEIGIGTMDILFSAGSASVGWWCGADGAVVDVIVIVPDAVKIVVCCPGKSELVVAGATLLFVAFFIICGSVSWLLSTGCARALCWDIIMPANLRAAAVSAPLRGFLQEKRGKLGSDRGF